MVWWFFSCALLVKIRYAVFETEIRPYSNETQNILQLSDSVNMLRCTHRHIVLSSWVCQRGLVNGEGFLNPSNSFWSLGLPVWLRGSKTLCQGSSGSPSPCPVGFPSIKQSEALHSHALKRAGAQVLCTHHFTGQPHKVMGNCQVCASPGHEWDPSGKQPVVSVSGRCARGTWSEVNLSRNQVQTCLLVGLKKLKVEIESLMYLQKPELWHLADWQDQNNGAKWIQSLQSVKQRFSESLLWIWIAWIPLLVPCVHPECKICVPTKIEIRSQISKI